MISASHTEAHVECSETRWVSVLGGRATFRFMFHLVLVRKKDVGIFELANRVSFVFQCLPFVDNDNFIVYMPEGEGFLY